jgi:glycosyltransferase involved in cell wall biosynthesis
MALHAVEIATYRARIRYDHSPLLRLITDETDLARLPPPLRALADEIWLKQPRPQPASPGTGLLLWRRGERLLSGTAAHLRFAFSAPGKRTFLPIHFDTGGEWELIGIEPRAFAPPAPEQDWMDSMDLRVRVRAAPLDAAPPSGESPLSDSEPWVRLTAALRAECAQLGAGIQPLALLAQESGLHPLLHSLSLRNLAVMLLRQGGVEAAAALLVQAKAAYPEYRELDYMQARIWLMQGHAQEAIHALQRATAEAAAGAAGAQIFVGSGGEAGYRSHHLLAVMAERTGRQQVALHHFLSGVRATPAYAPAVAGLLRQCVPTTQWTSVEAALLRLGRLEAGYQPEILNFFFLHRAFEAVQRTLEIWTLPPGLRAETGERLKRLTPLQLTTRRAAGERAGVVLHGPFHMHASVARINRYLAAALEADGHLEVALEPTLAAEEPPAAFPRPSAWDAGLRRLPQRLDLTVRHGWPPEFETPATGKLALILPWEFGAVPRAWVKPLQKLDEIWVPSAFVRQVLMQAGVSGEKIVVIPNGVDLGLYQPAGEAARPEGARATCFLFVGGAIKRKGMDLLLRAWRQAFSAQDDVSLVIKDMGARSFYKHLSLAKEVRAAAQDPGAAPILYFDEDWSEQKLPELYRGCDVVVLPYRGEGFGMPLAEGLACGKPVIATALGPAPEFCPAAAGWQVQAEERDVPVELRLPGAMSGRFTWFEPDVAALAAALRAAAECGPAERARRGALGAAHIRAGYDWDTVTARYRKQVAALVGMPARATVA